MANHETYDIDSKRLGEAADWCARLADSAACDKDWQAFTDWLEADVRNAQAYDRIEDVYSIDASAEESSADVSESISDNGNVSDRNAGNVAGTAATDNTVVDARHRFGKARTWATFAAAAAAAWVAVANIGSFVNPAPVAQIYETADNGRQVVLADGSRIDMNINSKLEVMLSDDLRRTSLTYGEAVFDVAKDEKRPFTVGLGDREVRVVGTVFNIMRHEGRVKVAVSEGIVDVRSSDPDIYANPERLTVGDQLTHTEGTKNTFVVSVNPEAIASWRQGYLEYEGEALADVVADLNRYFPEPIRVGEDVAELTFSGILSTEDQGVVLELLVGTLPVKVVTFGGVHTLTHQTVR